MAHQRRGEIVAARASAAAAGERPAIVSGLDDPMVMGAIDHLPFAMHGMDTSAMVEQRFPLSRELRHRRAAAQAHSRRLRAGAQATALDVELNAVSAFLMLGEERGLRGTLNEQVKLAEQIVAAAKARYGSATGGAVDLLRAEAEWARLRAGLIAADANISAAEAMLNASISRLVTAPVPPLSPIGDIPEPPTRQAVVQTAVSARPELAAGGAEVAAAQADIEVMRSMDAPMALVRLGVARTMAEGSGVMGLVGVSVPIYREKRRAAVREAEAMARMAGADLGAMTRMVEGEALAARESVVAARGLLAALRIEVVPRARQAINAALAAYGAGQGGMVTVLDAATALWDVEAQEVMAARTAGLAQARLRRATVGRPLAAIQDGKGQ